VIVLQQIAEYFDSPPGRPAPGSADEWTATCRRTAAGDQAGLFDRADVEDRLESVHADQKPAPCVPVEPGLHTPPGSLALDLDP